VLFYFYSFFIFGLKGFLFFANEKNFLKYSKNCNKFDMKVKFIFICNFYENKFDVNIF